MVFEWDGQKSLANEAKHGVGLDFGCYLWDGRVVTLRSPKKGEGRRLSIGLIGGEYWVAIWKPSGDSRRLISVRLATPKERSFYDRNNCI